MGTRASLLALGALRILLLIALAVSSALFVDYVRPLPAFCTAGSGCIEVRASEFARPFGIPMPLVGLFAFGLLFATTLARSADVRRLALPISTIAGLVGALLLLVQARVLGIYCPLCVVVDASAIAAALAALAARSALRVDMPRRAAEATARSMGWFWPAAGILVLVGPPIWAFLQPKPPVPGEVAAFWAPAKLNVVEFVDFECPFCRLLHPEMKKVLAAYEGRVHLVRINMPLPSHTHARDAARAYLCAEAQGKGDAMADGLFAATDLAPQADRALAASLGVSVPVYDACIADPATEHRLAGQIAMVRATGFRGLPTVWIGNEVIIGLQPLEKVRSAFARAADQGGPHAGATVWWLWGGLAGLVSIAAAFAALGLGRASRADVRAH